MSPDWPKVPWGPSPPVGENQCPKRLHVPQAGTGCVVCRVNGVGRGVEGANVAPSPSAPEVPGKVPPAPMEQAKLSCGS